MLKKIMSLFVLLHFGFSAPAEALLVFGIEGSQYHVVEISGTQEYYLRLKLWNKSLSIKLGNDTYPWYNIYLRKEEFVKLGDSVSMLNDNNIPEEVFFIGKNANEQIAVIFKKLRKSQSKIKFFSNEQFQSKILEPISPPHPVLIRNGAFSQRAGWAKWKTANGDYLVVNSNSCDLDLQKKENVVLSDPRLFENANSKKFHVVANDFHHIADMIGIFPSEDRVFLTLSASNSFFSSPLLPPMGEPSPEVQLVELGLTPNVYFEIDPGEGDKISYTGKVLACFADRWVKVDTASYPRWVKSEDLWIEVPISSTSLTEYAFLRSEGYSAEFGHVDTAFRKPGVPNSDVVRFSVQNMPPIFCSPERLDNSASKEELSQRGWVNPISFIDNNNVRQEAYLLAGTSDSRLALIEKHGKKLYIPGEQIIRRH